MAVIFLGIGYLVSLGRETPVETARLYDGTYSGFPEIESATLIRFGSVPVRLAGVDAPDPDQLCITRSEIEWHCGVAAAGMLAELVANGPIACDGIVDHSGSVINATCHDAEGINVNARLVELGWAVSDGNGTLGYSEYEDVARRELRGIWASRFEMPSDWRLRQQREE